jgi:hypothetical protein
MRLPIAAGVDIGSTVGGHYLHAGVSRWRRTFVVDASGRIT